MNYLEQSLTGRSWQRAGHIEIGNGYGAVPWIRFVEERITELSNGHVNRANAGSLTEQMTDPDTPFDLLNPADNSVVGTATYGQLGQLLHSLYYHLALARDTVAE